MSIGLGLIKKLITDNRKLGDMDEAGVKSSVFQGEEVEVLEFVQNHFANYGELPTIQTVERETKVKLGKYPDEPFGYWIDQIQERNASTLILKAVGAMKDGVREGDLEEARHAARDLVLNLDAANPIDKVHTLSEVSGRIITLHDKRQMSATIGGVPFGIEYLDRVSDGAQGADTVAFAGRPGVGKSYILLRCALSAWMQGEIPLVHTSEMTPEQCVRRILGMYSGITATLIRLGRLSHFGRNRLVHDIREIEAISDRPFYIVQGSLGSTIEDLGLRIQELRPTVLYADGAYLLRTKTKTSARWERVTETAEIMKMLATQFNIPAIATYQFNRRGAGDIGNIGYSDAIGQLASIVCSIDDEEQEKGHEDTVWSARSYKLLTLLKGREGEKGVIRMLYDMHRMLVEQESVLKGYLLGTEDDQLGV